MRRIIFVLAVIAILLALLPAMPAQTVTPNIGLNLPPLHSVNWGTLVNANSTKLDSYLSGGTPLPPGFWAGNVGSSTQFGTLKLAAGPTNTTAENFSNKGILNGYAPLDANVLVPVVNLPAVSASQNGILSSTDYNRFNAGIILFPGNAGLFLNGVGVFVAAPGCSTGCTFGGTTTVTDLNATGTITANVIVANSVLGGAALSVQGTSQIIGAFVSTNAAGSGISVGGTATGVDTWQMNSLTNNHLQFVDATAGSSAALDLSPAGVATATSFAGGGAALTGLNGANISTGNIAVARIATALTAPGPIGGTTAAAINGTTITGTSLVGGGSGITGLNATNISTGNVAVARIATALTTPGPIGGTTPSTGVFTNLTVTTGTLSPRLITAGNTGNLTIGNDSGGAGLNCFTMYSICGTGAGNMGMVSNNSAPLNMLLSFGTGGTLSLGNQAPGAAQQFVLDSNGQVTMTGLIVAGSGNATSTGSTALVSAALNCGGSNANCKLQRGTFTATFAGGGAGSIGAIVFPAPLTNAPTMQCTANAFTGGGLVPAFNIVPSGTTTTTLTFNLVNAAANVAADTLTVRYQCGG